MEVSCCLTTKKHADPANLKANYHGLELHSDHNMSRAMKKMDFCLCKNKGVDQCAVTAQLIDTFIFAIQIVQLLFLSNPKF